MHAVSQLRNTKLVRVESDAATNEARMVKYGPKVTRNRNAIDSSLIEFGRLQKEVFPSDSEMRDEIFALKVGEKKTFKIRSKEGRREAGASEPDSQTWVILHPWRYTWSLPSLAWSLSQRLRAIRETWMKVTPSKNSVRHSLMHGGCISLLRSGRSQKHGQKRGCFRALALRFLLLGASVDLLDAVILVLCPFHSSRHES